MHLLDPRVRDMGRADSSGGNDVVVRAENEEGGLAEPWSTWNITIYRHPLSASCRSWADGSTCHGRRCPAISTRPTCTGIVASSERMIVSPGHESEGIMHMPTGQSGHPLSPFYSNSHEAWVNGEATPFLPGPTAYTLTLTP